MLNRSVKLLLLLVAATLVLVACDSAHEGAGDGAGNGNGNGSPVPGQVTGTVVGYAGGPAAVVSAVVNVTDETIFDMGEGTIEGDTIKFNLTTPPEEALYLATALGFESTDPDLLLTHLFVRIKDRIGMFEFGNTQPQKPLEEFEVGDTLGVVFYADRPATLTYSEEIQATGRSGSATVSKGWNVITNTVTSAGEDGLKRLLGTGNISSFDWYYTTEIVNFPN